MMTNVQEWVEQQYSTKAERATIQGLHLNKANLTGELDCSKFPSLYSIFIAAEVEQAKLTFLNRPNRLEIIKLKSGQVAFDLEYPIDGKCLGKLDWKKENQGLTRAEIREMVLSEAHLESQLVIQDFLQLKKIELRWNKLTDLEFINCPQLEEVECRGNFLTQLPNFSQLAELKSLNISFNQLRKTLDFGEFSNLTELNCSYNHLTDLSPFSSLVNLERLKLISNQFSGSLAPVAPLTKLRNLNVSKTQLNSGLEYLPANLRTLGCDEQQFLALRPYRNAYRDASLSNYSAWRNDHRELIQILLAADQLLEIQTHFSGFFTKWEGYFTKRDQLAQRKQWIEASYWIKWAGYGSAITSPAVAYNANLPSAASVSLGLSSAVLGLTADYSLKRFQAQEKQLEKIVSDQAINQKLQEEMTELKDNYQKLLKIFTELSILSAEPTQSRELNTAFTKLLESLAFFPQLAAENSGEIIITIDEVARQEESAFREEQAKEFVSQLEKNWNKHSVNQVLTNLITEANHYRAMMYGLNNEQENNLIQSTQNSTIFPCC